MAPAHIGHAAFDPVYECVLVSGDVEVRVENRAVNLGTGTRVTFKHTHAGSSHFPVTILLPGDVVHRARSDLFGGDADAAPRDTVTQILEFATWVHYPSANSDERIELRFEGCSASQTN